MRMSVDWNNLTFKAKDILALLVFVGGIVFTVGTLNEKLNNIIENQAVSKEIFRDLGIRMSLTETELKLLKQRVDAWESANKAR